MEEIKNEYISNIVQEDIDTYISLHKEITSDLLEHIEIMTDQLWKDYKLDIK
jgi:hypothetical protein